MGGREKRELFNGVESQFCRKQRVLEMTVMDIQHGAPLALLTCTFQRGGDSKFQFPLFYHNKKETKEEEEEKKVEEEVEREKIDRKEPQQARTSLSPKYHASDGSTGRAVKVRTQNTDFLI